MHADFNKYVDMMRKNYVTIDIERERMKAAFSLLDIDGDGFLSRQELMDELVTKASGITIICRLATSNLSLPVTIRQCR
jgi:Ca2+-binding EF-hand superfamily protein